jgi:hypothetical protein
MPFSRYPRASARRSPNPPEASMDTRSIAIAALVIAVVLVVILFVI